MAQARDGAAVTVLGDIGSTFIKLVGVTAAGTVAGQVTLATTHDDIEAGVERAHATLARRLGIPVHAENRVMASSAGGGLRVVVVGLERRLTLEAGLRVSATAGARIVASYAGRELHDETPAGFLARRPDLVLLTGGTNGGDRDFIVRAAEALARLAPALPVVVAGNEQAYDDVRRILGTARPVVFAGNVMPGVGHLEGAGAQRAIRELFIEHVIGRGRYAWAPAVAGAVRMPTPAAVLAAAVAVAALGGGRAALARPVIVDVGGATTDVHSLVPDCDDARGYATSGLPDQVLTRTVEGDLGLRENAEALVQAALGEGYLSEAERPGLQSAAERRARARDFVARDGTEMAIDERLATLATALALHRHAGVLQTTLTPAGAVLRRTGRDLRHASCLILTGGVFHHSRRARVLACDALRAAHARQGLVAADLPVFRDRRYLLWAVGLLRGERPELAAGLAAATLSRPAAR